MILPRIAVLTAVLCLSGPACTQSGKKPTEGTKLVVPKLGQAEREAIVAAANEAIKGEKNPLKPDDIPAARWGDAITKLNPVSVRTDQLNVAIVMAEKDGVEEGLYVSIPISSYAPTSADGFEVFEQLSADQDHSFGRLYHYRRHGKAN
jgi:hypothetical protein